MRRPSTGRRVAMANNRKSVIVVLGVVFLLLLSGGILFFAKSRPNPLMPGTGRSTPTVGDGTLTQTPVSQESKYGIDIQLKEGRPQSQAPETLPVATGEPLSAEEIQAILSRLPVLTPEPEEQVAFHLPQEVLPPPRPGETIQETFPPTETGPTPEAVESGPLQVLRFAPEGDIPIAPFVSVTFNQPMVPIGTLGDLAAKEVPVKIEPSLPGTWRWLGTKTLTFEYDSALIDRLPKATEYRATVPAGIKSVDGEALAEAVNWTFRTPPPKIVTSYPSNSPQPLDPIFFISFDQRIDPDAVLKTIQVNAGGKPVSLVMATQAEIDKDKEVSQLVKNAMEGRWLAFRATESFSTET